jgi:hypothetical protein
MRSNNILYIQTGGVYNIRVSITTRKYRRRGFMTKQQQK